MQLTVLQFAPVFGDVGANLSMIETACAGIRSDLVVLPELCTTGYQFRDRTEASKLAEQVQGPAVARLVSLARLYHTTLAFGFAESSGERLFNSAALVNPKGLIGLYRKVHLFREEKAIFDPGDLGFPVFAQEKARIGLMICFDWLFPESARSLALAGAQVIAHPANLVLPFCQAAMVTRAIENRVFTVTANRIGEEARVPGTRLHFAGHSRIVGPDGEVLTEGPADEPAVLQASIDPARADDKRFTPQNDVLQDRRLDQYRLGPPGSGTDRR